MKKSQIYLLLIVIIILAGIGFVYLKNTETLPILSKTSTGTKCIQEGGNYSAPETSNDFCCPGLVEQPASRTGTWGICVKPPVPANETAMTNILSEKDMLNASYKIYANFGAITTTPQQVIFPKHIGSNSYLTGTVWIDQNSKLTTTAPTSFAEAFWIYKYEFTDSNKTQAKVYISGNFGASGQDNRVYFVKKINNQVITEESK